MSQTGLGRSHRKGLTLLEITRMFPDDAAAEKWIAGVRWPDGPFCPHCGSYNVQAGIKHRAMTHRCRDCEGRKMFSLKTGTVMQGSKLGCQAWAIAFYLVTTNLKGVSSMKLHRDLGVTQKTAWHLAHRIRESLRGMANTAFEGPVEADETDAQAFDLSAIPAVNVASVPQRSPLRYPGGKTWLIPHVREWLRAGEPASALVEPFAGGGTVALTAVMEDLVDHAIMVDLDRDVAAFWRAALDHPDELIARVQEFRPQRSVIQALMDASTLDVLDHGFRTLVLNRTRRGGVLAPGASFVKNGENGNGVASRWYPDTLSKRIRAISEHADRLTFFEGHGERMMDVLATDSVRFFVDPPYTAGGKRAGARLYAHNEVDHKHIFQVLARTDADFMMTYDYSPEIVALVQRHGFHCVVVEMKNGHHARIPELVITRHRLFS